MFTAEKVVELLHACGLVVSDRRALEERPGKVVPIPAGLYPRLAGLLRERYPRGLYTHQAQGIEAALAGQTVCVATATASGKSLVFMAAALDLLTSRTSCAGYGAVGRAPVHLLHGDPG